MSFKGTGHYREQVERKTYRYRDGAVISRIFPERLTPGDYRRDVLALCDRIDELEAENAKLRDHNEILQQHVRSLTHGWNATQNTNIELQAHLRDESYLADELAEQKKKVEAENARLQRKYDDVVRHSRNVLDSNAELRERGAKLERGLGRVREGLRFVEMPDGGRNMAIRYIDSLLSPKQETRSGEE